MPKSPTEIGSDWDDAVYNKMYAILRDAFHRADAAARAVASLEHEIAEEMRVYSSDEAEEAGSAEETNRSAEETNRDFDDQRFHDIFDRLNVIKLISELSDALELEPAVKQEVLNTVVHDQLGPSSKEPQHPRQSIGRKTLIGDDLAVYLHNAKETAARNQASRRRNGQ